MASQSRPEPMNASPHHSKVKVTVVLSDTLFVAGSHITGKVELECRADKGLGIGVIVAELLAIQGRYDICQARDSLTYMLDRRAYFQRPFCH